MHLRTLVFLLFFVVGDIHSWKFLTAGWFTSKFKIMQLKGGTSFLNLFGPFFGFQNVDFPGLTCQAFGRPWVYLHAIGMTPWQNQVMKGLMKNSCDWRLLGMFYPRNFGMERFDICLYDLIFEISCGYVPYIYIYICKYAGWMRHSHNAQDHPNTIVGGILIETFQSCHTLRLTLNMAFVLGCFCALFSAGWWPDIWVWAVPLAFSYHYQIHILLQWMILWPSTNF